MQSSPLEMRQGKQNGARGPKMPNNHVMIDLETLSSNVDAVITSIGAVSFDPETLELGDQFKVNVDPASCERFGLRISASTVLWWFGQSRDAQQSMLTNQVPLDDALSLLTRWMQAQAAGQPIVVWGNGIDFDGSVLRNAYKAAKMWEPWKYSNGRCYRTIKAMFPEVKFVREGVHHDALADALSQTKHLLAILRHVRGRQS